jgi:hypothetical protein
MHRSARFLRTPLLLLASAMLVLASCGRGTSPTQSLTGLGGKSTATAPMNNTGITPTLAVAAGLTLSPASVVGGSTSTGTLAITGTQADQARVNLSSSNGNVALPAVDRIFLNPGATSATFTINTFRVTTTQTVTISADLGGVVSRATLTVTPAAAGAVTASTVTLTPTSVAGGAASTGRVTLTGAAPATGATVTLSSANIAVATVPASVVVAAGATSATFAVTSKVVAATSTVAISAAFGGVTRSATLTVTAGAAPPPAAALSAISLASATVTGAAGTTGTATLTAAAPTGGSIVALTSSNTAAATVPASVTVPAGATSATFPVTTKIITAAASVTITGTMNAVSRTAVLTVNPPNPCASVAGLGGSVVVTSATVPQFRLTRLRVDLVGDVPGNWLNAMGTCSTSAAPTLTWLGGTATVTFSGTANSVTATGAPLTFGALTPPVPAEPGVVLNTDAAGNVLQLIWPALAGLPPGPPTLRLNLAVFSPAVAAGSLVNATLVFNVRGPDGSTATFTGTGTNMVVPPLR